MSVVSMSVDDESLLWLGSLFEVTDVAPQSHLTDKISCTVGVNSPSLLPPKQRYGLVRVFSSGSIFL